MKDRTDNASQADSGAAVLAYLNRQDYRPLPQRQLLHRMHVSPDERPVVRRLIKRLLLQGKIVKLGGGRLAAAPTRGEVTGILHRHRDGYGFVTPDSGGADLFVAPPNVGEAMSGDRVVVRPSSRGRGRGDAVIVRTVSRAERRILGLFTERGRGGVVHPFDPSLAQTIEIQAAFRMGAGQGQVVHIELLRSADSGSPQGKVLEVLGHLDDPGTDALIMIRKYGLETEFPADVLEEAAQLPSRAGSKEVAGRTRYDDPAPVTIDGETAKDFDDAIAVEQLPRGALRLFVHIADVAHFVRPGSALDREALRRGTSVYFPHRVLPMLPEKLSNDLCSLRPGVDRLVQTVIIDFDAQGTAKKVRVDDGVIRSAARLTYTQVAAVFEGAKRVKGLPPRVVPMLHAADRLRRILEARRHRRGSVDFDLPEPQILLDVEGVMTGITIEPRNHAHRLIEEFMLAANEAIAGKLEGQKRSCMYRIHETPDPDKLETLKHFVESFGVATPDGKKIGPGYIRDLMLPFEGKDEYGIVSQVALRSMKRARYSMENSGHFGLAAPTYCHFTSPIRRYPDLVVHRLLRIARSRRKAPEWEGDLEEVAQSCSDAERNAEAAEREILVRKKIAFIADKVGESFPGIVSGVTPFGLFVQLSENLVEGLIRVDRLGNEPFQFIEARMELRGSGSRRRFRLGDRLDVVVDRADRILQRVDFSLAGSDGSQRQDGGRPGAGRGGGGSKNRSQGKSRRNR